MKKLFILIIFLASSVQAKNSQLNTTSKRVQCTQKYVTTNGICGQSKYSLFPSCMGNGTYTCVNNVVAANTPNCASTAVNNCPRGIGGCSGTITECIEGTCGGSGAAALFGVWQNGTCQ